MAESTLTIVERIAKRAAMLADLPISHLRLMASNGDGSAKQANEEFGGNTRGELIEYLLMGEFYEDTDE